MPKFFLLGLNLGSELFNQQLVHYLSQLSSKPSEVYGREHYLVKRQHFFFVEQSFSMTFFYQYFNVLIFVQVSFYEFKTYRTMKNGLQGNQMEKNLSRYIQLHQIQIFYYQIILINQFILHTNFSKCTFEMQIEVK
eukprot:TRINITY_DN37312_c0_g1_i1.p1 TRINITY_DN37312_c0_g1~~TRINITY_DN37312_c0_g1_i1.p1  ORF type:complete len:136 (+),score=6.48 TRINITY_DN37312_c0_g1_i1:323-730(+)